MKLRKLNIINVLAVLFIFAGIWTILVYSLNLIKVGNARYKREITMSVVSLTTIKEPVRNDTNETHRTVTIWLTQEEGEIDGQKIEYQGKYYDYTGPNIKHTLISKDGKTWEVNDASNDGLVMNAIVGVFCILAGTVVLIIRNKK